MEKWKVNKVSFRFYESLSFSVIIISDYMAIEYIFRQLGNAEKIV